MVKFSRYCKDLNTVKNKNFITINSIVIDYDKAVVIGDIDTETKCSNPIILEDGTNRKIILFVNGTEINKKYSFIYLLNTHLAVIISE